MIGFKFGVVASILVAGFDAAVASPAVRYGMNHWGGYGSLVRMALRNMDSVAVDAEYYTSISSPSALGSSAPFGTFGWPHTSSMSTFLTHSPLLTPPL